MTHAPLATSVTESSIPELCRLETGRPDADRKRDLGQFFTPLSVAALMASFFGNRRGDIRMLDAGAGAGALTVALIERLCEQTHKPERISVTAFEVDPAQIGALERALETCRRQCEIKGIRFASTIRHEDFIETASSWVARDLFASKPPLFDLAIVNPPYRKIRSDSPDRLRLRSVGIETGNLYSGFVALITRLLAGNGELVAITPRSFCNGPYFKPFRLELLKCMSLRRVHLFDSRSAVFGHDGVLQENIVFHAVKSEQPPARIIVSQSSGEKGGHITEQSVEFDRVVMPRDKERFIHIPTDGGHVNAEKSMGRFSTSLKQLGLTVSTGRVVDFRAKEFLREQPAADTVPLIYPCHFDGGFVSWPGGNGRKPNALVRNNETRDLLVPSGIYVLVKRFTSKEERRRVVASIYDPRRIKATAVGFENHLNYFHVAGAGLSPLLASGLSAYLNSSAVDAYFRQFNGHTQVNATDLRNMPYPSIAELEELGRRIQDPDISQETLDALVGEAIF